jgi:hypothetical protein
VMEPLEVLLALGVVVIPLLLWIFWKDSDE